MFLKLMKMTKATIMIIVMTTIIMATATATMAKESKLNRIQLRTIDLCKHFKPVVFSRFPTILITIMPICKSVRAINYLSYLGP